jgi:putative flippase GtrA
LPGARPELEPDQVRLDTRFNRFLLNGLAATAVHYAVLTILIEGAHLKSAGIANGIAAVFGISASYSGNKWLVFQSDATHRRTLPRFLTVYALVALMHAGFLAVWTDYGGLPYSIGFLIVTAISIMLTFITNKFLVFNEVVDKVEPTHFQ